MFRFPRPLLRRTRAVAEQGTATAEYAVATLGACSVGTILVKLAQSDWFQNIIKDIISKIPDLLPW
jgi:hypothetical protein